METNEEQLRWRFDINAFRLLGKELITDKITAIFELVKNSYDANATHVHIKFMNVGTISPKSQIIVEDDGLGMTLDDIKNKWMVVGTSHKRHSTHSPAPFYRKYVGSKGVGRFAVDKLGKRLRLQTKVKGVEKRLNLDVDWEKYEALKLLEKVTLFTDVDNTFFEEQYNQPTHGTALIINQLHDVWTKRDIDRLYRELGKLIIPFYPQKYPFHIQISSNEYEEYQKKNISTNAIVFATYETVLDFSLAENWQEVLIWNKMSKQIEKRRVPISIFGPVKFHLYYFNDKAKRKYLTQYSNEDAQIDGLKLYRDGILTTPFVDPALSRKERKDVFGIDTQFNFSFATKIYSKEYIGILEITEKNNPQIIDSTDRQEFLNNETYQRLKEFVFQQLVALAHYKDEEKKASEKVPRQLADEVALSASSIDEKLAHLEDSNPELKSLLLPLRTASKKLKRKADKAAKSQIAREKEITKRENLFFSMMSLVQYAHDISHTVNTVLGRILRMAEYFQKYFPDENKQATFKQYSIEIFEEVKKLMKTVEHLLSYAKVSESDITQFSIKKEIQTVFNLYKLTFEQEDIHLSCIIRDDYQLTGVPRFFHDILENLITNSVKALRGVDRKHIIKCSSDIEQDCYVLYFSDNGIGIKEEDREKIFDIYHTTTAQQGGGGLGLYIIETRLDAMKGKIALIEPELGYGATFKITIPFNREKI